MKFLQVNYDRALPRDDADQLERMTRSAHKIAGLPGLLWKLWVHDDADRVAGGMYLFASEEDARAWADGPMVAGLSSHPGISGITYRLYDVDADLSAITRGPLGDAAP